MNRWKNGWVGIGWLKRDPVREGCRQKYESCVVTYCKTSSFLGKKCFLFCSSGRAAGANAAAAGTGTAELRRGAAVIERCHFWKINFKCAAETVPLNSPFLPLLSHPSAFVQWNVIYMQCYRAKRAFLFPPLSILFLRRRNVVKHAWRHFRIWGEIFFQTKLCGTFMAST